MRKFNNIWASPVEAIFYITLVLSIIGLVNVFSASFVVAQQLFQDSYFFLKRQTWSLGLGIIIMAITSSVQYNKYQKFIPYIFIVTVVTLIGVIFYGVDANGARRWLNLGIKFQPSEFAKITGLLITAGYLGPRLDKKKHITLISMPIIAILVMGGLILQQPDMGTAIIVIAPCITLFIIAGISQKEKLSLYIIGLIITILTVFAATYRAERISVWLDPWTYSQGSGYQIVQSLLAVGSGGILGNGLGMGSSKFHYLPEAYTDFAFALFSQETGFIGSMIMISLFFSFSWYGIKIAVKAKDGFGVILAAGITLLIMGQTIVNLAMILGLLPVIGIPLPFISYGGTSLVINMALVGLLINIGRNIV